MVSPARKLAVGRLRSSVVIVLFAGNVNAASGESRLEIPTAVDAATRPITVIDLTRLREITAPFFGDALSISPDGEYLAFQLRQGNPQTNSYDVAWFVAPTNTGMPAVNVGDGGEVQLRTADDGRTFGEHVAMSPAKWSPDSRWIAYLVKRDGEVQLWRSRADGGAQEQLTRNAADVRDFVWDRSGTKIFLKVKKRERAALRQAQENERRRGYLFDDRLFPSFSLHPLETFEPETDVWVFDLDGQRERKPTKAEAQTFAALIDDGGLLSSVVAQIPDFKFKHPAPAYKAQWRQRLDVAAPVRFKGSEERVAFADVVQPQDRAFFPTAILSVSSTRDPRSPTACHGDSCKGAIENIWWSGDGREIYFVRRILSQERRIFAAWSPEEGRVREILKTDAQVADCTPHKERLICLYSASSQPTMIVSLDLRTGAMTPLIDPNPEFRSIRFTTVERLDWSNEMGAETFGYLVKPRNFEPGKRFPLVILTYRAVGFFHYVTGGEYPADVLADNGFMVLVFQRPFDSKWKRGGVGRDGYVEDLRNVHASLEVGIKLLDDKGLIDPERIALTGLSNGTTITLFELTHSKRNFAAAIVSSDTDERMHYYLASEPVRRRTRAREGFSFSKDGPNTDFYALVGPSENAEKIRTPILFHLPEPEVLTSMRTLVNMQEYGKPFEAYVFPADYHVKWQPAHLYNINRRNVQWLQFWLQDKEVADPVDPEQYVRWRRLREQHQASVARAAPEGD